MESFCARYSHNRLRVHTHIYIFKEAVKFLWHKNGIVERRWFISLISNHANLNDDQRFSCKMGGREGLLLADGFICLLFLALRGYRSIRSNRWKFAKGQRCFSPFLSLLFFSLFFFSLFSGEESATITTDLSDHGLINDSRFDSQRKIKTC